MQSSSKKFKEFLNKPTNKHEFVKIGHLNQGEKYMK